jgi:hypothetical protein
MKTRNRITKLITITMVVAAMAVIGSSWAAGRAGAAGRSDVNDMYIFQSPVGIIPGEGLRISVGSAANSSTTGWFRYSTTNPGGVPLYESEWIEVPQGGFDFSDVSRRDLNTEGEPGTRRVQMMVRVEIEAPSGSKPSDVIVSVEIIEEATGRTSGLREMILMGIN